MKVKATGSITLKNITEPFSAMLTNEMQQFSTDSSRKVISAQSYYTDIIVYQGTNTRTDYTIGAISSANGVTVTKTTTRVTFSVSAGMTLSSDTGSFIIPITLDGKTINKTFSWSCGKQGVTGATGASAKSVSITASSQIFKSTDGGVTFSPDTIKLTPVFQGGIAYSKWQYSTNGGSTWTDVVNGNNGLYISSGVLTINKTSTLYTDSITSISFKCISNNSSYYDICTVIKLYDVTDIEIGGRNLISYSKGNKKAGFFTNFTVNEAYGEFTLKSKKNWASINIANGFLLGCRDYTVGEKVTWSYDIMYTAWNFPSGTTRSEFWMGQRYTSAPTGETGTGTWTGVTMHNLPAVGVNGCELNKWYHVEKTLTIPAQASSNVSTASSIQFYNSSANTEASFTARLKNVKLERGNKATDWTPAPEDAESQIETLIKTTNETSSIVDKLNKSITDKVWQNDVTSAINNYDKTTAESDRKRISIVETNLKGITSTVKDMQTTVSNKADGSTVTELTNRVAKAEQNAEGFKQTVESTYAKQTDLDNLKIGGRNLLKSTHKTAVTFTYPSSGYKDWFSGVTTIPLNGDTYTLSFWAKSTVDGDKIRTHFYNPSNITSTNGSQGQSSSHSDGRCDFTLTTNLTKYWVTYTIPKNGDSTRFVIVPRLVAGSGTGKITVQWEKLEESNKPTDWTPAPEDTNEAIDNVNKYAKTSFEQLSDKFTWLVTSSSSNTSLTLTNSMISAITKQFVIKDPNGSATIIEGGKIKANSITTNMLSSSAIKSNNYIAGTYKDGAGYSSTGTFLDLSNGMIHTPGFYTDGIGNAFFNGTVNALAGWFGTNKHNWYIGSTTFTNIMNNDGALTGGEYSYLKATDNAAIVVNEWHLQSQNTSMSLQSGLTTLNNGKFVLNPQDNKYYDFGVVKPDMSANAKSYNKKFLYIRRASSPTTHPQDWEYLFHVDYDGSIWYKDQNIAGGNIFLSTKGGTIDGNLTVTGTLNATANQAKKVANALSVNGKSYDGSAAINVGTIGIAYGGTGGTTASSARTNLSVPGAKNANGYYGLTRPDGNEADWIRTTSNGFIPYQSGNAGSGHSSIGTSTWYFSKAYIDNIYGSLRGTADKAISDDEGNKISSTYLRADVTEFDSLTVGNLIVNGNARFINGLKGELTGNVIGNVSGNASTATTSQNSNYINVTNHDGIRFNKNDFAGGTLYFGYKWSDGSTSPLITEYKFYNGNGVSTQVTASQFNGNLNGIATKAWNLCGDQTVLSVGAESNAIRTLNMANGALAGGTLLNGHDLLSIITGIDFQWYDTNWRIGNLRSSSTRSDGFGFAFKDENESSYTLKSYIDTDGQYCGNATSATKLQTARKIGNTSFDGTSDISLSSIGASPSGHTHNYASTLSLNGTNFTVASNKITVSREQLLTAIGASSGSVNGYMSAADKSKLDSITVSDIGTVGANSIKGTGYIKATISKGVATLSHNTSGVTAGTYGADSTNNLTIPKITVDSTGHITSANSYTVTAANIVSKLGTTAVNRATSDSDGNTINSTYLKLSGGTMNGTSMITWADSGNWGISNKDVTFPVKRGGLKWNGQSDGVELFAEETGSDNLDLVIKFTDDNSNGLSIRNNTGTQTARISATGVFTGTFSGNASSATKLQTACTIFGKSFDGTANVAGQATVYGSYNARATSRYMTSGIQVRENSLVGSAQSDIAYAPSIGFHWSKRIAATLLFHSDGNFYFRKQNFTDRATIDANLTATSVSSTNISASGTLGVTGTATFTAMSVHNGGIKSSLLQLQGSTTASIAYGATNPKIRFVDSDGSQIVDLMYNDYDSVRKPAGLAMRGNQGGEYFDVPHLYANQVHVDNHCALQYDSSNQCLNFVFS